MRLFIACAEGYIAGRLKLRIPDGWDVYWLSPNPVQGQLKLDLEDTKSFDISVIKPEDCFLFLAAISSPDMCAERRDWAWQINVTGTSEIIRKILDKGAKVLFLSSDTVYGAGGPYDETSECHPLGAYGKMKHEVEKTFTGRKGFFVLRLSYVFSAHDKFTSYLSSCAAQSKEVEIYHPFLRNGVYIEDLLSAIISILSSWPQELSVCNACGRVSISRLDMARFYAEIDNRLRYSVITPDDSFYEARPKEIEVKSLYFEKILGTAPLNYKQALIKECKLGYLL